MKLLTKELRDSLPHFMATEDKQPEEIPIIVTFFHPLSNWTWYATEGEPILNEEGEEIDFHFFGLVRGFENELGYFSLNEMKGVKGPCGLGIERDLYFGKHTLAEAMEQRI